MIRKVYLLLEFCELGFFSFFSLSFLSPWILPQNVLNLFFNSFYFHSESPDYHLKPLASTGHSLYLYLNFVILQIFFLAATAALYLGSSLTDSLTDGSNIRAQCHNSVIFQHRDFKFSPKSLKNYFLIF